MNVFKENKEAQHFVTGHAAGKLRSRTENAVQSAAQAATSCRCVLLEL
jgi:hypothetical protein